MFCVSNGPASLLDHLRLYEVKRRCEFLEELSPSHALHDSFTRPLLDSCVATCEQTDASGQDAYLLVRTIALRFGAEYLNQQ